MITEREVHDAIARESYGQCRPPYIRLHPEDLEFLMQHAIRNAKLQKYLTWATFDNIPVIFDRRLVRGKFVVPRLGQHGYEEP